MSTSTDLRPWQASILEQLEEIAATDILDDHAIATRPHLVIGFTNDEEAALLARCETADQADEEAALHASKGYEHIAVHELAAIGFPIPATVDEDPDPADTSDGTAKGELFDASDYEREDLAIAKVDGNQVDRIAIKVSGRVMLDRSDPADVALFNRLKLNQEVELRCAGKVTGIGAGFTTGKDGDLDAVVSSKNLKVDTIWVLDPEDM